MTKQEFQEYYKNNKTVVIGVPIILAILLLDFFVLKPARVKKAQEKLGTNPAITAQAVPAASQAIAPGQSKAPITLPDPIRPPAYPKLSDKIDIRFQLAKTYPYPQNQRNIFNASKEKMVELIPQIEEETTKEVIQRPDISYHGFFSLGPDKVAILKTADQLLLTKVGSMLRSSPFRLSSVLPDHVILIDTQETNREFEIALSENSSEEGGRKK